MPDSSFQDGSAGTPVRVSVIVPCRNESGHVAACLAGLLGLEAPAGGFEVVVADGMSDDGSREILQRLEDGRWQREDRGPTAEVGGQRSSPFRLGRGQGQGEVSDEAVAASRGPSPPPRLRLIDNPGRLASCGLNAAIRTARGDIIVRADAHTDYSSDYLLRCLDALQQTGADNVGGPARTKAEAYRQRAIAAAYHSPFSVGGARFHDPHYEGYVDTVTYGCWPRSTFEKFGFFDEELVRNQDDEHNLRITRGGGKVYQSPKIKSWYKPRGSLTALFKQYMQYGYWKVRVIQKHKLPASWRHLVPGAFVLALMLLFLLSALCFPWPVKSFAHFTGQLSALCFISLLSFYLLAVLAVSVITAARSEWKLLPVLPLVFPCYHFGYGYGFLRGVLDFLIRRKGAQKNFATLTR